MSSVELKKLNKYYKNHHVVKEIDLTIEKGEFLTLLGPSGCGKTTTLRMVAGLEAADSGDIFIGGNKVTNIPANRRKIGMVFQSYALFPNMTALENVMFGLRMQKVEKSLARQRAEGILSRTGLGSQMNKYPHQMSGGQQQRVAVARALVVEPEVLLLDEPLSALDAKIRESLRDLLKELQRDLGITTIFVTHDQDEALALSDRIAVMDQGHIAQLGTPESIYRNPATQFVAKFIGTCNFLTASAEKDGILRYKGYSLKTSHSVNAGSVTVGVRPESLKIVDKPESANTLDAQLLKINLHGNILRLKCRIKDDEVFVDLLNDSRTANLREGDTIKLYVNEDDLVPVY